jgi:hypothetical protein
MARPRADLLKLARAGAERRLTELQSELASLFRLFPDLRRSRGGAGGRTQSTRTRRRRGWSAAQRKAAADRMRKYWAARKGKK